LIEYAQDERELRYQVEEATGKEPSAEHCFAETVSDSLAECKTSLYMQKVLTAAKAQLNRWIQVLVLLGLACSIAAFVTYAVFLMRKKS
jgi:hypothetical protein